MSTSRFDLTQLRYFAEIASCGSMTAAARSLAVSQPTLSVAMRQLEESLGTTLFLRHRGGVTLTETGEELLRHVHEVSTILDQAVERITGLDQELVGSFVLGCHESLSAYFLPHFMPRLFEDAPRIELSLHNAASADVTDAVLQREVHFGIVVNPRPHPELVMTELFSDAIDVFVARQSPVVEGDAPDGEAFYGPQGAATSDLETAREHFASQPLIFASRVRECQEVLRQLHEMEFVPRRVLTCGDFELVKSLALADIGVALLPRRVAAYGREGCLRRLHAALPIYQDTIYLLYRSDVHRTRAAVFLKDALIAHARAMPSVGVG